LPIGQALAGAPLQLDPVEPPYLGELVNLPTWADRHRTFQRVAASLRPGGRFAWNVFAFDHRVAARLDGELQEEPVPHTIRYSVGDNRIDITLDDGAKIPAANEVGTSIQT
jgi:hypothetical protein